MSIVVYNLLYILYTKLGYELHIIKHFISVTDSSSSVHNNFLSMLSRSSVSRYKMAVEKIFNLCQFISCVEKVILPPKNGSQYLTFDQCSKTCRVLDSELLSKDHLMTMTLVQTRPLDVLLSVIGYRVVIFRWSPI